MFIKDYPDYIIFPNGDIYSTLNRKITKLKPGKKPAGYRFVGLNRGVERKYEMVHRLVAKAFIPNSNNYLEVNHKDGNKDNNHVENLEWVTPKMNQHHARATGLITNKIRVNLSREQVLLVFSMKGKYRDIGKKFGISAQTVCNIKNKKNACYAWIP